MNTTTPAELTPAERTKIFNFLSAHPVGVLATADAQGNPHASPIYFTVDSQLHLTFTTKRETNKYENIARNPAVMLVAYEPSSQTTVQLSGKAVEVTDPLVQQEIYHGTLEAAQKTGEDVVPPIAKIHGGPYVGFTVKIENIWLSEYGWGDNFANAMKHVHDKSEGDPA